MIIERPKKIKLSKFFGDVDGVKLHKAYYGGQPIAWLEAACVLPAVQSKLGYRLTERTHERSAHLLSSH